MDVTHDVKCIRFEKPGGYQFLPGQATDVSINKPGLDKELRPFTFTSLTERHYLEFTIKRYEAHHGITDQIHQLKEGDELIIRDPWGAIEYKGPGYFIAGGAGITPFIAILRQLHKARELEDNILFFSNKTVADIIYHDEIKEMMGENSIFLLTREKKNGYESGRINEAFIRERMDPKKHFYICGPDEMVAELSKTLEKSGASTDTIIFEK